MDQLQNLSNIRDIKDSLEARYGIEANPLTQLIIISPPTIPFRDSKLYSADFVFTMPHLFTQDFNLMAIPTVDVKLALNNAHIRYQQLNPAPTIPPTHQSEALLPHPNPDLYLYTSPATIMHNDHELGAHFLYQPRFSQHSADRPRESRMFQFYPTDRFSDDKLLSNFDRSQQCTVLLHLLPPADVDQYGSFVEEGSAPRLAQDLCLTPETLAMFPIIIINLNSISASLLRATQFLHDFAHLHNTGCALFPLSLLDNMSLFFIIKMGAIHLDDSMNTISDEVLIFLCKEMGFKQPPTILRYGEPIYNPVVAQSILNNSKSNDLCLCPSDIAEIDFLYSAKQRLHDALTTSFLNHFQAFHLNLSPYEQFTRYFRNALRNNPNNAEQVFSCASSTYASTPPFLEHPGLGLHRGGVYLPVLPYLPKPILSLPSLTAPQRSHVSRLFFQNAIQVLQLLIIPIGFVVQHCTGSNGQNNYIRDAFSDICFDGILFSGPPNPPTFSYTTEIFPPDVKRLDVEHYYQYEHGIFKNERLALLEDAASQNISTTQNQQPNDPKTTIYSLPPLHQEVQYFQQGDFHISTPVITTQSHDRQSPEPSIAQSTPKTTVEEDNNIVITPIQLNQYLGQLSPELQQIYVCKPRTLHFAQPPVSFTSPLYQCEEYKTTCYQQKHNIHGLYKPYTRTNKGDDQAGSTIKSIHLTPLQPPPPFTLDTSQHLDRHPIYPNAIVVPKSTLATIPPHMQVEIIGSRPFFSPTDSFQTTPIIPPTPFPSATPPCDESNDVTIHSPCQRYNYTVQVFNAYYDESFAVFLNVLPYRLIAGVILLNLQPPSTANLKYESLHIPQLNNFNLPLHIIVLCPSKDEKGGKNYDRACSQIPDLVRSLQRYYLSVEKIQKRNSLSEHVGQGEYFTEGPFVSINDLESNEKQSSSFFQPLKKSTLPIADPQSSDSESLMTKWKIHIVQNHSEFVEAIHRINFSALASRTLLHEVSLGNICVDLAALPL